MDLRGFVVVIIVSPSQDCYLVKELRGHVFFRLLASILWEPFQYKHKNLSKKYYILLLHLEWLPNQTTDDFIIVIVIVISFIHNSVASLQILR